MAPTLKGYNALGTSSIGLGMICMEIERVDSAYRSALGIQSALVAYCIDQYGSQEQKDKYLPGLVSGD